MKDRKERKENGGESETEMEVREKGKNEGEKGVKREWRGE